MAGSKPKTEINVADYVESVTDKAAIQIPAEIFKHAFAYGDSLAVRAAIELRLFDIIHSHGEPMSLSQIASKLDSDNPDTPRLSRLLRFLVYKNLLTMKNIEGKALYALKTPAALMLLHDFELSLAPMFLTFSHPLIMAPWFKLSQAIKEGGQPFEHSHGQNFWEKGSTDPDFNDMFNAGMASFTTPTLLLLMSAYEEGFRKLEGTLVDVGGGIGKAVGAIVDANPHIKGINFDQPHVVATAPQYPGVTHVGGNMFKDRIPDADTIFIKDVLHDWGDEECVKLLKNCQKAISGSKKGKVIIVDEVLQPGGEGLLDDLAYSLDLWLMADCVGGITRTEDGWKNLLENAGFARHNIVPIPNLSSFSIIEAFLQ